MVSVVEHRDGLFPFILAMVPFFSASPPPISLRQKEVALFQAVFSLEKSTPWFHSSFYLRKFFPRFFSPSFEASLLLFSLNLRSGLFPKHESRPP